MSLLHALVARGTTVLVEHDAAGGSRFSDVTQTLLSKIPPNDSKLTYAADEILIHYQKSAGITVMVVSEDSAGRRMPFGFLATLHRQFVQTYPEYEDLPAYGANSFEKEIKLLMKQYQDSPPPDALKQAQLELNATKDVMVKSIDAVLSRGERIEILVDRTDEMSSQAKQFRKRSTVLRRKMWWRNGKVLIAIGFSGILLFYLLVAMACGLSLSSCRA
ncbi:synaptobrevin family protein [Sporobolomyces salmoneus]|uniref:synaptobrevin family protein n=1 Tax=Sporobolomyces salmoneus TaxID=183962 RepID=UPI00316CF17F